MTDINKKLSALYDGELEKNEIDNVLRELENSNELKKTLSIYSLIGLSIRDKQNITHIASANLRKDNKIFSKLWLSNALTAAASILLTLFVVNYADFSRMNISTESANKIASAVNSKEAKEVVANSNEFLVDHIMNVINDPAFMDTKNTIDLRNVGYNISDKQNLGYSNGRESFKLRIENSDFGLNRIRYWRHGNKMIYLVPISNGRVVTIYGNISASKAIQIANSIKQ